MVNKKDFKLIKGIRTYLFIFYTEYFIFLFFVYCSHFYTIIKIKAHGRNTNK